MDALENLDVWKRSCRLSVELYKLLSDCRDFGFRDQVTRSALSVPSNIAEGYERDSSKEFSRFLKIAKGSCGELRTQLYIGTEAGFIEKAKALQMIQEAAEISRMLQGLIRRYEPAQDSKRETPSSS
ncbi:four helix bundle protein [Candidatus Poribacteria bacterium]|nr:four helix bundle protein [Candidatus Poribacteria bacterium]